MRAARHGLPVSAHRVKQVDGVAVLAERQPPAGIASQVPAEPLRIGGRPRLPGRISGQPVSRRGLPCLQLLMHAPARPLGGHEAAQPLRDASVPRPPLAPHAAPPMLYTPRAARRCGQPGAAWPSSCSPAGSRSAAEIRATAIADCRASITAGCIFCVP